MSFYDAFSALGLDLSPLGLAPGPAHSPYDCTPPHAQVLGWAGVDGIHYCFVPGYDEMVFAVSPMALPGDTVHPVARSFEDFLRLLLACGSCAALDQAHGLTQPQFEQYLAENQPDAAQAALLAQLKDRLALTPVDEPFGYLQALQGSFGPGRLAAAPPPPAPQQEEWKVYFAANFSARRRGRPGRELPLGRTFTWGPNTWHIPAAYLCGEGLVLDLCVEVAPERIRAFLEKWLPRLDAVYRDGGELLEQLEAEDPLHTDFHAEVQLNGLTLAQSHGCSMNWVPASCPQGGPQNSPEAPDVLQHYGLDPARGWSLWRLCFPWAGRRPAVRSLSVRLSAEPVSLPGPHFLSPAVGEGVSFIHPFTGVRHVLTVEGYEQKKTSAPSGHRDVLFPPCFLAMSYTLSPALPQQEFVLRDCARSDKPCLDAHSGAAPIGIIGGTDGPTAFFVSPGASSPDCPVACSSLHFEPVEQVEWRMLFYRKPAEDIEVTLLE